MDIDHTIRTSLDKVYNGNTDGMGTLVQHFYRKYADYIYTSEEYKVESINWENLKRECSKQIAAAGGLDGWTKADLTWASGTGFIHMAGKMVQRH